MPTGIYPRIKTWTWRRHKCDCESKGCKICTERRYYQKYGKFNMKKPTCLCGICRKCKARARMKKRYHEVMKLQDRPRHIYQENDGDELEKKLEAYWQQVKTC